MMASSKKLEFGTKNLLCLKIKLFFQMGLQAHKRRTTSAAECQVQLYILVQFVAFLLNHIALLFVFSPNLVLSCIVPSF